MSSHGPTLIRCHCGQTLEVRQLWPHLQHGHRPAEPEPPAQQTVVDYASLDDKETT